ncbi:MAG: polysaccharide biosynthesis protein [Candidatus Buchananbacteria bacterium RIFCSPHIGHO2_02_FULL_56_16]|uniref:Polysaccharide biosynthesis protein n=1 Tax=Candidatus Buchananbacteria bacterium RIFCSPHIGHO2_02_FULL_56_16 TaxID=1797542 RepID=A0A1G1YGA1_9BACT|nr:MAG: polysaccharide biosynthesis protein [Candidatus Buchananbacteria bacterium RIFCSPHIGHO2_02_FULL_56_16]
MKKYQTGKPYLAAKERKYVLEVLNSGSLSLGPKYQEFERRFARLIGTRYACAVSSGTAGLHLAMITAGITRGDEVITTPFSFIASANCVEYVGARPVFVDIDPVTYNIDPKKIERAITKKTKAILVVHIFGQAADMAPIVRIAKRHRLQIIEDACESINATYRGKKTGTFGTAAVFAFYPNKQMTTGEGGMVVTNDKKVYERCCSLRNQGRARNDQWLDHRELGYNYRLDEMSAALGIAQLEKLNWMIAQRQKIAGRYRRLLKPYQTIVAAPIVARGNVSTWFVYVVRLLDKKINRDRVIKELERCGINAKPYLPPIHLMNYYRKKYRYRPGSFPITEAVSRQTLALPFYLGLTKKDISHIVSTLIRILKES